MAVKQQVFKSTERNEAKLEPFISWQTDRFSAPGCHMKRCELHTDHSETQKKWRLAAIRKRERQSSSLSFSLNFCPCASHHLSLQLYLDFCTSSVLFLSQGDSCEMNVTPLTMLGEIDSLASVLSTAICWSFIFQRRERREPLQVLKSELQPCCRWREEEEAPFVTHKHS